MPQPTSDTTVSRPDLGQVVSEFRETSATGAIGLQVMPYFPVGASSEEYPVIPKEVMLKIPDTRRAMRQPYPRSDWEWENGFYKTRENGWEEQIDDRERKLYATLLDAEIVATQRATKIVDLSQEKRIADMVFNSTTFTAHAVTNEWDDAANATPIEDINDGVGSARQSCGMVPNALIIAYSTFKSLKNCDQVIDRLKYTFPGIDLNRMTSAQLAQLFDLEKVLVGGAVYDSADKGQDASISDLWDNEYAMLTRISSGGDIKDPCLGRTFYWTEENAGQGPLVESYREGGTRSDVIRVRHDTDERLIRSYDSSGSIKSDIAVSVSYLLSNVTT